MVSPRFHSDAYIFSTSLVGYQQIQRLAIVVLKASCSSKHGNKQQISHTIFRPRLCQRRKLLNSQLNSIISDPRYSSSLQDRHLHDSIWCAAKLCPQTRKLQRRQRLRPEVPSLADLTHLRLFKKKKLFTANPTSESLGTLRYFIDSTFHFKSIYNSIYFFSSFACVCGFRLEIKLQIPSISAVAFTGFRQ